MRSTGWLSLSTALFLPDRPSRPSSESESSLEPTLRLFALVASAEDNALTLSLSESHYVTHSSLSNYLDLLSATHFSNGTTKKKNHAEFIIKNYLRGVMITWNVLFSHPSVGANSLSPEGSTLKNLEFTYENRSSVLNSPVPSRFRILVLEASGSGERCLESAHQNSSVRRRQLYWLIAIGILNSDEFRINAFFFIRACLRL